MSDIRYLRGFGVGSPYTVDIWETGNVVNLYGIKLKYAALPGGNPTLPALKPLKIGNDGSVHAGLIDLVNDTSVSGNVDWNGHSIVNLAAAVNASSPVILSQLVAVSGILHDDLDYVSGVLQDQIDAITNDLPWEFYEVVSGVVSKTIFDVTPKTFSSSNSVYDVQVFINRGKIRQGIDFAKLDDHRIQINYDVLENSSVTVREERTGGTGGGGGGSDLENIAVNPQPITDGAHSLGTSTKAWAYVILKDQVTGFKYRLEVSAGVLQAVLVP